MKEAFYSYTLSAEQVRQVRLALQQAVFFHLVPFPEELEPFIIDLEHTAV